jgi:hypothetical protein
VVVEKKNSKKSGGKQAEKAKKVEQYFDWNIVDSVLSYGATMDMVSSALANKGMYFRKETIAHRIKEKYGMTFADYRASKMVGVKIQLIQRALNLALTRSDAMLIFCLKNLVGWVDKPQEADTQKSLQNIEDIVKRLNVIKGEKANGTNSDVIDIESNEKDENYPESNGDSSDGIN